MSEFKCGPALGETVLEPCPFCGNRQMTAESILRDPSLHAQMLRDLLGGPEWEELAQALARVVSIIENAGSAAYDDGGNDAALLRKLAGALTGCVD